MLIRLPISRTNQQIHTIHKDQKYPLKIDNFFYTFGVLACIASYVAS